MLAPSSRVVVNVTTLSSALAIGTAKKARRKSSKNFFYPKTIAKVIKIKQTAHIFILFNINYLQNHTFSMTFYRHNGTFFIQNLL